VRYDFIYATVEVFYDVYVAPIGTPTVLVSYADIRAYPEYAEIYAEAELVEEVDFAVTW
jgi:hypothetical protein